MRKEHFIAMDAHCRTTDVCIKTAGGKLRRREHCLTAIPQLREVIESVPRPRRVALEESSIAGWLYRNLKECCDELIVCDPRRNAYVAKDGDKDDPIDAEKLNDLHRGGFLRPVHQLESVEQAAAKQLVGMYHDRVRHRVGEGCKLLALGKRWGLLLNRLDLIKQEGPGYLQLALQRAGAPQRIVQLGELMRQSLSEAVQQEEALYRQICQLVKEQKIMARVAQVPGYGPVRAATLISYLDTPWRFRNKAALWKYVGIGLTKERSGDGPEIVHVEQSCNRLLRNVVIGAAQSAINQKENVFAQRHARWMHNGLSPGNARRNVARDQVSAIWAMWKSDRAFDAELIGASLIQG